MLACMVHKPIDGSFLNLTFGFLTSTLEAPLVNFPQWLTNDHLEHPTHPVGGLTLCFLVKARREIHPARARLIRGGRRAHLCKSGFATPLFAGRG